MQGHASLRYLLFAVVIIGLLVPTTPLVTGQTTELSVASLTVSPDRPAPGERVTIEPTIRNLESSPSQVRINAIELRGADRGIEYERIESLGTITPGMELRLPITQSFETTGTKDLRLHVFAQTSEGKAIHLRYPITITVRERNHPQLEIEATDPVADAETTVNVTVANGLDTSVSNVRLSLGGSAFEFDRDRRILAKLEDGEASTFDFGAIPQTAGEQTLTATLEYMMPDGSTQRVTEELTLQVEELDERLTIEARPSTASGTPAVIVDVINLGNTAVENVVVNGAAANASVGQAIVGSVPATSSKTVRLNVSSIASERMTVDITTTYEIGTRNGELTSQTTMTGALGKIELTGVNVERDFRSGAIQITGSASNVGLTDAKGVVVRVQDSEMVSPSYPNKEYFVGEVPASDFASFDVYASIDRQSSGGGPVMIPVEVSYLVDGDRQTRVVQLQYDPPPARTPTEPRSRSPLPFGLPVPIVGAVVVGLLVIGGYVRWVR